MIHFVLRERNIYKSVDTGNWVLRAKTSSGEQMTAQLSLIVYANAFEHLEERKFFRSSNSP